MLNAVNIALVAISNFRGGALGAGTLFALFIITLAAAEVTVGLAIVIANYRNRRTVQTDQYDELKG
jgi:NADH-quinone oxidoreductase subunit K